MKKINLLVGAILTAGIIGTVLFFKQTHDLTNLNPGVKVKGTNSAAVKIIVFSDFQCPSCRLGHRTVEELMKQYPEKVQVQFAHFPLRMHQHAQVAHRAAECAHRQGQFWPYHDRLYELQDAWSKPGDPLPTFLEYAKELKLNMKTFQTCLDDPNTDMAILAEKAEGHDIQVERTPTYIINGERLVGGAELQAKVEALLGVKVEPTPPSPGGPPSTSSTTAPPQTGATPATPDMPGASSAENKVSG